MNAYASAIPSRAPGLQAELAPAELDAPRTMEYVRFYVDEKYFGLVVLPSAAAFDLVHRLADVPSPLREMTAELVGHVRWWLDTPYRHSAGPEQEPSAWTCELIELIRTAEEEPRRLIGLGYCAYTTAVAIATGPGGLDELRRLHDTMRAAQSRAVTGG